MLSVRELSKVYPLNGRPRTLFEGLSFDLPPAGRLAVLGRNGQGKSTLIRILGGVVLQTTGNVRWDMTASWPLGMSGGFQGGLSGIDNMRFVSRVYNRPSDEVIEIAERFAELGDALTMPVRFYSSGMRARLAFGISLAIEFDCYLIDEVISVGDVSFQRKCHEELFGKRAHRAFIIASHHLDLIKTTCTRAILIEGGRAKLFDDIDLALEIYTEITSRMQNAA